MADLTESVPIEDISWVLPLRKSRRKSWLGDKSFVQIERVIIQAGGVGTDEEPDGFYVRIFFGSRKKKSPKPYMEMPYGEFEKFVRMLNQVRRAINNNNRKE